MFSQEYVSNRFWFSTGEKMDGRISVVDLDKHYEVEGQSKKVLSEISLDIEAKQCVTILGLNGSGKSTLLRSILGIVTPDSGSVSWNSRDYQSSLGVILEGKDSLYERLTPIEHAEYLCKLRGKSFDREYCSYLIEKLLLVSCQNSEIRKLSTGNKRKAALLCNLVHKPNVLILDEPTLGLDLRSKKCIVDVLKQLIEDQSVTVVLTTHDLEVASQLSDRLIYIENGVKSLDEEYRDDILEQINLKLLGNSDDIYE